jgi:hypothetical protein
MPPIPEAIQHFRAYLQRRNYATHTLDSYRLDLQLFFTRIDKPLHGILSGERYQKHSHRSTLNSYLHTSMWPWTARSFC